MDIDFTNINIGLVVGLFNREITQKLEEGALQRLKERGIQDSKIQVIHVPGAFEIPLIADQMLQHGMDVVIALGCVIRGETSHYDYVCNAVERGCSEVALKRGAPVVFGILTTENEAQALDRVGGAFGHKGTESAEVALSMLDNLYKIRRWK